MKNTSSNLPVVASVNFHGTELITIRKDDHEFVAMKPVVEGIGLAWQKQHEKLSRDKDKFSYHLMVTTGKDGKKYEMSCMPITKLNGWLFTINPNKIPNLDVRKRVIEYQEECFIALYEYWHKGKAERPVEDNKTISPSEQHSISLAVKTKAGDNHKAIPEIWSRVHNKFKVAKYTQIQSDRFNDVIEYILGMELKAVQATPMLNLEMTSLKEKIIRLEEQNKYLETVSSTYLSLYRDLIRITVDLAKSRQSVRT